MKHCDNCSFAKIETAQDGWQFYACHAGEYKGKYVGEIKNCPIEPCEVCDLCSPDSPECDFQCIHYIYKWRKKEAKENDLL